MRLFVRIMRGLTTAFVVAIVMTAVGLLVIPRLANWTVLVVLSGSMEPVMPTGGLALVEPVDAAAIKVGDVVTFPIPDHPGALVSHRVTAIELDAGIPVLLTKGDANETPDAWRTPASSVSGKVAVTVPYLGHAAQLMRTPGGFLLVLIVPAMLIVLGELGTIAQELRKMRQKSPNA
jgi:signal peptidase